MQQLLDGHNDIDADGNPAGGEVKIAGSDALYVRWQNGPLAIDGVQREPNGAFAEDVIAAAIYRLEHYQQSRFACRDNAKALKHLYKALAALEHRTAERTARGVEGTHEQ